MGIREWRNFIYQTGGNDATICREEDNLTYEEDLEEFEKGNWLVEYSFWMEDKETVVIDVLCGRNEQELANQPEWVRNRIKIEELKDYDYLNIEKIIKMF